MEMRTVARQVSPHGLEPSSSPLSVAAFCLPCPLICQISVRAPAPEAVDLLLSTGEVEREVEFTVRGWESYPRAACRLPFAAGSGDVVGCFEEFVEAWNKTLLD